MYKYTVQTNASERIEVYFFPRTPKDKKSNFSTPFREFEGKEIFSWKKNASHVRTEIFDVLETVEFMHCSLSIRWRFY